MQPTHPPRSFKKRDHIFWRENRCPGNGVRDVRDANSEPLRDREKQVNWTTTVIFIDHNILEPVIIEN